MKKGNEAQRHSRPQGMTTGPSQDTTRCAEGETSKLTYWTRTPQRNNRGSGQGEGEDPANKRAKPPKHNSTRKHKTSKTRTDPGRGKSRHVTQSKQNQTRKRTPNQNIFLWPAPCAFRRVTTLRLTRLPRHDRGPVPGGNRSAASCLCTVLRRTLYHYATRSPRTPNQNTSLEPDGQ